jgi:hypothetical protein
MDHTSTWKAACEIYHTDICAEVSKGTDLAQSSLAGFCCDLYAVEFHDDTEFTGLSNAQQTHKHYERTG